MSTAADVVHLPTSQARPVVQAPRRGRLPASVVRLAGSPAAAARARRTELEAQLSDLERQYTAAVREALDVTRRQVLLDRRFAELEALHCALKPRMDALAAQLAAIGAAPVPWRYPHEKFRTGARTAGAEGQGGAA